MANTLKGADLGAMFGIELAPDADTSEMTCSSDAFCTKCKGKAKFYSYAGKLIGDCFACQGTGLRDPKMGTPVAPGDCAKCYGSGEWRPGRSCFACNGTGKEVAAAAAAAIDVSAIVTAFSVAYDKGIKRPKLRLGEFQFSRAPDHGKNAGSIYVKKGDAYLGKVTDSKFLASFACDAPTKEEVIAVAADPATAAKAYGQRTGSCSCCGRELTNAESIALGIGPICASRFGF